MHIAYSVLQKIIPVNTRQVSSSNTDDKLTEPLLRYKAYNAACQKLSHEIAAIQKYNPGWMPAFR